MAAGSVAGCCRTADGMLRLVLQSQLRVALLLPADRGFVRPGRIQSYCGTAMGKTRGSPCL